MRYYQDYISKDMAQAIKPELRDIGHGLRSLNPPQGLETPEALAFLVAMYKKLAPHLEQVLNQRMKDRKFIDDRCKALYQYNVENKIDLLDEDYQTLIGLKDENDRVVIGPISDYKKSNGKPVADIPSHLQGVHVTLFGPPGEEKMSINAMNAYHRKLKEEPAIVAEILADSDIFPKWGADDEDSKTPLHADLCVASENLRQCFTKEIYYKDEKKNKEYKLAEDHLSLPIKRFPGLALPSPFMFIGDDPMPMHLYDFALHFFHLCDDPSALTFYVPKLENEEEAAYIREMFKSAEELISTYRSVKYQAGSIRCIIVLENPRAVFRVNEMMDELYPYFAGASLGWHDYLGSTARLLKEEGNYRIPVKADPDIVIKYIKASHELLSDVVGARGGIKIGGMYGILPLENDLYSDSFQMTIRGYIRDVVTQMKRNLSGFWVAHPDFVRLGIALVEAWKKFDAGNEAPLKQMVYSLLNDNFADEVWDFIVGEDIEGLDKAHPRYDRSLIVADIKESSFIANNHPDEIRYNVFQSLQYLTDWLTGNGCVALPAMVDGVSVRVMDDLATAERSRWEVWHELYHGRFKLEEFIKIVHEEMHFIRKDLSHPQKIVQIKYTPENAKWYDCAVKLMLKLMTDTDPAEFATEYLIPFTIPAARTSEDPWQVICEMDPKKYQLRADVEKYFYYFEMCGCEAFAKTMSELPAFDEAVVEEVISNFTLDQINEAAFFHGNIGESSKSLDKMASQEQAGVEEALQQELLALGTDYRKKFGFKFLVSAQGKTGAEMLKLLKTRMDNSVQQELDHARAALLEITLKRVNTRPLESLKKKLTELFKSSGVHGLQLALQNKGDIHSFCFGSDVHPETFFEIASLSKTIGTTFAIEMFKLQGIRLNHSVNELFAKYKSDFRLEPDCELQHLMRHTALNMHYVNGLPTNKKMPPISDFLFGMEEFGYEPVKVVHPPGTKFQYSGAGFIVLEALLNLMLGQDCREVMDQWLMELGITELTMHQETPSISGYRDDGTAVKLMFPSIAAGAQGSARAMLQFMNALDFNHITKKMMYFGKDLGAMDFMGAKIGLGTFITEAGENRFSLHQGANDGFRSLYLYCFEGPDKGFGLTAFSNGELKSVELISKATQIILEELNISGIDYSRFKDSFQSAGFKQEEVVNRGYKELIFSAFLADTAEAITYDRKMREFADRDLLKNAKVAYVSSEKFARAENLISPFEPAFDPTDFGRQGKVMDSWETPRHNEQDYDELILALAQPVTVKSVEVSTKFHLGNQATHIELLDQNGDVILSKTPLMGHALKRINISAKENIHLIQVRNYPDGGISRLGLFDFDLDECDQVYPDDIPQTVKPLALDFDHLKPSLKENLADFTRGARIISASDEHYAPAKSILSPFAPLSMFDGFESARSREQGHFEKIQVQLSEKTLLKVIEFDFTFFVNNNPRFIEVLSMDGETIVPKSLVKPYAGSYIQFKTKFAKEVDQIEIRVHPDGGFNRLRVFKTE